MIGKVLGTQRACAWGEKLWGLSNSARVEMRSGTCVDGHPMKHPFVRHIIVGWRTWTLRLTIDVRLDSRMWVCAKCLGI